MNDKRCLNREELTGPFVVSKLPKTPIKVHHGRPGIKSSWNR